MNTTHLEEEGFSPAYVQGLLNHELVWLIASLSALVYDNLITIADEIQFIWKQDFSGRTVIFFVNRYFTLLVIILCIIGTAVGKLQFYHYDRGHSERKFFAALRIYAICDRTITVPLIVLVLSLIPVVMNIIADALPGEPVEGCSAIVTGYTIIVWILEAAITLTSDTLVIVMTWIKTAGIRREALRCKINVPISTLLLRDGTIHFILFLCMSVTDMILMFFDPSDNNTNIAIYAFRSITLSHFMINLRQVYLECEGNQALGTLRSSSIRFATSVVGNLGAPLSFGTEGSISMDQRERSSDPLAAGLYLGTNNEEDHVLLCEKTHPESPSSAAVSDWQELFEDEVYGQKLLNHVHRGDTLNSIEHIQSCDGNEETEEDYTKP